MTAASDESNMADVVYHGRRSMAGDRVVTVETNDGEPVGALKHVVRHSPSGLNWGYKGSGPSDTARSLLLAALGDAAACPECQGSARVVYVADGDGYRAEPFNSARHSWTKRGWQCKCWDGYKDVPYIDFADIVATWGEEWRLTRSYICAWLRQHKRSTEHKMSAPD